MDKTFVTDVLQSKKQRVSCHSKLRVKSSQSPGVNPWPGLGNSRSAGTRPILPPQPPHQMTITPILLQHTHTHTHTTLGHFIHSFMTVRRHYKNLVNYHCSEPTFVKVRQGIVIPMLSNGNGSTKGHYIPV